MMPQNEWYAIKNIDQIDSPALIVYPERIKKNIQTAIEMVGGASRLRPHVKTNKTREVINLLLQAGIQKFKCATIAEAELLAMAGAPDVLLAYQPVGPKLHRFLALMQQYPETNFSCLTDNRFAAEQLAEAATGNDVEVSAYIDINVGMNRTGIAPGAAALALYDYCAEADGLKPLGLHVYDGHIRVSDLQQRALECHQAFAPVEQMRNELVKNGHKEPIIIAGGTPTFPIHAQRKDVECSPGTFVYWDRGYQLAYPEQNFLPAALVITRVISLPDNNKICLDLGHKSVAAENELAKRIYFLNAPELKAISQSEEHLVMETVANDAYKPGAVLYGLPYHICPTCALYERAWVAENGMVVDEWEIVARARKINV